MEKKMKTHNQTKSKDRIRIWELDDSIYEPKKEQVKSNNYIPILYFTFSGNEDRRITLTGEESNEGYPVLDEEESNVYAKRTFYINEGQYRYFIKRGTKGTLINPIDMYDEGLHNKIAHGISSFKFNEVNKTAFLHYINFLKTKNLAHLRNAERETM